MLVILFDLGVKTRREDFYNMDYELESLLREFKSPLTRMIIIKGVRRVGKSSLLRVALSEINTPHLLLDLRAVGPLTPEGFYDVFTSSLSDFLSKHKGLSKLLKRISGIEVMGVKVELTHKKLITLTNILKEINEWAQSENTSVLLILDEAQELALIRGFDKLLAHIYDYLNNIKIVLAGSEVGLLSKLIGEGNPESPLFGRAYIEITIDRLPRDKAEDFLKKGFQQANIKVPDHEISEAVNTLNGIIGWLTYYGYYRLKMKHEEALQKTIHEGAKTAAQELEHFLAPRHIARRRYIEILRITTRPSRWIEIKRSLRATLGLEISDKQVTNYLHELVKYGFLIKKNQEYVVADPLLAEAIKKGYIT